MPGYLNVIADGLSQANEGTDYIKGNRSEWMVLEDWEAMTGLIHNIFNTSEAHSPEMTTLHEYFTDEPIFTEVIDAMLELDQGISLWKRR